MKDKKRIRHLLNQIYNPIIATQIVERLSSVLDKYRGQIPDHPSTGLNERDVILIVYPDQVREQIERPSNPLEIFVYIFYRGWSLESIFYPFSPRHPMMASPWLIIGK